MRFPSENDCPDERTTNLTQPATPSFYEKERREWKRNSAARLPKPNNRPPLPIFPAPTHHGNGPALGSHFTFFSCGRREIGLSMPLERR